MKPNWQQPGFEFANEAAALEAWARAFKANAAQIRAAVGLTWAGSPVAPAMRDWQTPARSTAPTPAEDPVVARVAYFMSFLADISPDAHAALTARHRRVIRGTPVHDNGETDMAITLYRKLCIGRSAAADRLARDCESGYQALRRHLARLKRAA